MEKYIKHIELGHRAIVDFAGFNGFNPPKESHIDQIDIDQEYHTLIYRKSETINWLLGYRQMTYEYKQIAKDYSNLLYLQAKESSIGGKAMTDKAAEASVSLDASYLELAKISTDLTGIVRYLEDQLDLLNSYEAFLNNLSANRRKL